MSVFRLKFEHDLNSINVLEGRITIEHAPTLDPSKALETLSSINDQIKVAHQRLENHMQAVEKVIYETAIQIAVTAMGEDEDAIRIRLERFAQVATEALRPRLPTLIAVHPSCLAAIEDWIAHNHAEFKAEIYADENLAPGDCRVENGEMGVSATLESMIENVRSHLEHGSESASRAANSASTLMRDASHSGGLR